MGRELKTSSSDARSATVEHVIGDDAVLVTVSGLIDERFPGFGDLPAVKTAVINVAGIHRMNSFGVRQWLNAMDAVPKSITDMYLLGCPTVFVDQLNMVLNFGGQAKVLTAIAPYMCPACQIESAETIDVLANRATLTREAPQKYCSQCGGRLEFDETPQSYFTFATKYGATSVQPAAAALLQAQRLYVSADAPVERPPRIIKLVHGAVTYFRIIGSIGSMFRARPLLVGAEGEVVIDLAEVDRFDPSGQKEWRRLIKSLAAQVTSVTLVDVNEAFLGIAGDTLTIARNVSLASLLVPYACVDCRRVAHESEALLGMKWPTFEDRVCSTCGGTTRCQLSSAAMVPFQKASTAAPPASAKVVELRNELLSRALTDANVAQAGGSVTVTTGDVVLGKYQIVRRLSQGGMAEVFLAKQIGIGGFEKAVAIKRIQNKLLESRHRAIELFLNEAKIAARLTHPNIVQVLDVGEDSGALFLAMEYVHGKDLRDLVKKLQKDHGVMPLAEACYVIREVALALHYAYWSTDMSGKRLSVVHRDVSPHNVILGYDGTVKLLDFGVAMSAITEHEKQLIVGKWTYMSPETTTTGQSDHRSDLFSLGVVLYLLCSGAMPFSGSEPKEIVTKIRASQYRRLSEIAPQTPAKLAALVNRLLSSNPDRRPQKGEQVAAELSEIMREQGLESSAQKLADYVASVFPNQGALDGAQLDQIVRLHASDSNSEEPTRLAAHTPQPGSIPPLSITPSARTSRRFGVSEPFRRVTTETPVPRLTPPALGSDVAHIRRVPVPPTRRTRDTIVNTLIAVAILALIGIAAYLVTSSY